MGRLIDEGLSQFRDSLFEMGNLGKKALTLAIEGYLKGIRHVEEIREISDTLLQLEVNVQNKAIELIARYQPVASDLRNILSYLMMSYNFSRFGRYAWDIANIQSRLGVVVCEEWMSPLMEEMSEKVLEVVNTSIIALEKTDLKLAMSIAEKEDEVDRLYIKYLDILSERQSTTKCMMLNILVVRYMERISDHAAYVGESITYFSTGKTASLR